MDSTYHQVNQRDIREDSMYVFGEILWGWLLDHVFELDKHGKLRIGAYETQVTDVKLQMILQENTMSREHQHHKIRQTQSSR